MNLSEISIKNPVFAWMLMIGLMVFGVLGCHGMGVGQMPDVDRLRERTRSPGLLLSVAQRPQPWHPRPFLSQTLAPVVLAKALRVFQADPETRYLEQSQE